MSQLAGPAPPPLLPIVQSQPSSSLQSIQLQQPTSEAEHGGGTALTTPASAVPAGLFMGDSLAPLPAKIVKKIIVLEYVEMVSHWNELGHLPVIVEPIHVHLCIIK